MTTLSERIPVDEITAQAKQVKPGRTLLTLIAGALFGLGWIAAKIFAVAWFAFTWCWAAVGVGWKTAHGPSRSQQLAALTVEVKELRTQVGRFNGL